MIKFRFTPLTMLSCVVVVLASLLYSSSRLRKTEEFKEEAFRLKKLSESLLQQKEKDSACLASLKKADKQYVDKHLETLSLLESEAKRLQALSLYRKENAALLQRLEFLKEGKNRLVFIEKQRRQTQGLQEIEEKLQHLVECNDDDLKKMIDLIEKEEEGKPQLLVKEFDLTRKKTPFDEEVYAIDLELIKRESL